MPIETPLPPSAVASGTIQRHLRASFGLAAVLPLALVLALSFLSYQQAERAAHERLERSVDVALENALKVFESSRQLIGRVNDLIGDRSDEQVTAEEPMLHGRLNAFVEGIPQVASINIIGRDGRILASSRFHPPPAQVSVSDRADFQHHVRKVSPVHVSRRMAGRVNGEQIFNLSVPRASSNGEFNGVLMLSLRPGYFAAQYERMVKSDPGVAISLMRSNGEVIARVPAVPLDTRLPHGSRLQRAMEAAIESGGNSGGNSGGSLRAVSTIDGEDRMASFRTVGGYPLAIVAATDMSVWQAQWLGTVGILVAFTLIPTAALCATLLIALRRLRGEEDAWTRYRAEVASRVALEAAYRQSRKLEALGRVTGGISHDFNNILMVVGTSTEVLRRMLEGKTGFDRPLAALQRAVNSGTNLTRQLLAFARRQPLRPQIVDLAARMPEFASLLRATLGSRVTIDLVVAPDVRPVHVDEAELDLALLNLALNARDAMPSGGRLTITIANTDVAATPQSPLTGAFVRIAVGDTGEGIAPEDIERVFEPFWTSKAPGQGTGLGLSQVHAFCEQSGGQALIASTRGEGTTVTLLVPAAPATMAEADVFASTLPPPQAQGRILLVEDNADVAASTRSLLQMQGFEVDLAVSADEALARLRRGIAWDLVLSDVVMPGNANGIELARTLRREAPQLPLVLMTGYTPELAAATAEGFAVIAKPFDTRVLRRALDEAMQRSRLAERDGAASPA